MQQEPGVVTTNGSLATRRFSLFCSSKLIVTIDPRIEYYFERMSLETSEALVKLLGKVSRGQADKASFHYVRTHKGVDVFRCVLPCGSFFDGFYPNKDRKELCLVVAVEVDKSVGNMVMYSYEPEPLKFDAKGAPIT